MTHQVCIDSQEIQDKHNPPLKWAKTDTGFAMQIQFHHPSYNDKVISVEAPASFAVFAVKSN